MNIYAEKGDKVVFTGEGGYEYQRESALKVLSVGRVYTIDKVHVEAFYTTVYLEEVEGSFNSVLFEDFE